MPRVKDVLYKIEHDIWDSVTNRFGKFGIVVGYYINHIALRYDVDDGDGSWYEYWEHIKATPKKSIWFNT
jgi:hypothetical protein